MNILIVDDDEILRGVISLVLEENGHAVATAASAEEALTIFDTGDYPLVVTDICMGGMSGLELLRIIKAERPETQVIIITSYASLESAVQALRAGAYDYLIKPFEDLDLVSASVARAIAHIELIAENRQLLQVLKVKNCELEQHAQRLKEQTIRDGLTNLYNHRYFQEALRGELARAARYRRPFSLLFMDLDHFKLYNDTNGHPEGDRLLRTVGEIFARRLRNSDTLARYGGEEFVVLLPETAHEPAMEVAEEIRLSVAEYPFPGRESQEGGRVTVSIGISVFPQDGRDSNSILLRADQALYMAKKEGRNRVCLAGEANSAEESCLYPHTRIDQLTPLEESRPQ